MTAFYSICDLCCHLYYDFSGFMCSDNGMIKKQLRRRAQYFDQLKREKIKNESNSE